MLALAGATYQGVFHNPLADPYLLGVRRARGLARPSRSPTSHGARRPAGAADRRIRWGWVAVVVTWASVARAGRERDATTFVLAGVAVASFFTAVQTFVQQQNSDTLQEVYSWILGALPSSGWSDVACSRRTSSSRPP